MTYRVLIIVSLIISLSSDSYGGTIPQEGKSPPAKTSILNDIWTEIETNNSEICPTPKEILESEYVKECDKLPFPPANTNLTTGSNHDTFLCLALYDRAYHICHMSSRDFKIPALQNKSAFDALIANAIKDPMKRALETCEFLQNVQHSLFKKTKPFVDELSLALKNPGKCISICWNEELSRINPLCLVIQVIDEQIQKEVLQKEVAVGDDVKGKGAKKNETAVMVDPKGGKTAVQTTGVVTQAAPKLAVLPSNPQAKVNSPSSGDSGHGEVKNTNDHQSSVNINPQAETAHKDDSKKVDKSKPKPESDAAPKAHEDTSPTQEQSPPVSDDKVKKGELPKKSAVAPKDDDSPSQMIPPGDDAVGKEVEKSTVSDNTGGEGVDAALGNDESINADMGALLDDDEPMPPPEDLGNPGQKENFEQPNNLPKSSHITADDDSHFFGYFTLFGLFGIAFFAAYHHKHKIFAMLLEGRRSRGGRGRRRPSTANYRKLDCTLEEAVTSQCSSNVTHVIY